MITVNIKLFAIYQEVIGASEISQDFPPDTPVSAVLELLINQYPQLDRWQSVTQFGIDLDFVTPDTIMRDRDEIVLIPPVSGG
jgi:sulfur-carrier protein